MIKYLLSLFTTVPAGKQLSSKQISAYLTRRGYKELTSGTFTTETWGNTVNINFMNGGIHIKIYGSGYSESDFIKNPITKEQLKGFLRSNGG